VERWKRARAARARRGRWQGGNKGKRIGNWSIMILIRES
jgi:mannan endo-1,4-beta-mannosidase